MSAGSGLNVSDSTGGGGVTLLSTRVGFGDGSDEMTGSTDFTWDDSGKILYVNGRIGVGQTAPTSKIDIKTDALGAVQTASSGLALTNTTAAINGTQQISPAVRWSGFGFKTSGSVNQSVDFQAYALPVQGSGGSNVAGIWRLQSNIAGVGYTDEFTVNSDGFASAVLGLGAGQLVGGFAATALTALRLTNAGGDVIPNIYSTLNTNTAGFLSIGIGDLVNGIIFAAGNGTRHIGRAGLNITNLTNTAGAEAGDLIALTQNAGAAMTQKLRISALGNIVAGAEAAVATTGTDGFLYIPTCAGLPTGVPSVYTGKVALIFDTTNNKLMIYDGSWLGGTTPGIFV